MSKIIYIGLFLDRAAGAQLCDLIKQSGLSLLSSIKADHLTLKFGPTDADLNNFPINHVVTIVATGFAADNKAQAVVCSIPSIVAPFSNNSVPHITVSVSFGTPPKYSNELLTKGIVSFIRPTPINTRVGYYDGQPRFSF